MSSWLTSNPRIPSSKKTYVTTVLMGGLANRIFQIFAAQKYAQLTGRTFVLCDRFMNENEHEDKATTDHAIKELFGTLPVNNDPSTKWVSVREESYAWFTYQFDSLPKYQGANVVLEGYWQNPNYIPGNHASLPLTPIPMPYAFIHFRFGDYIGSSHELPLQHYYRKSILRCIRQNPDIQFLVFTDDEVKAEEYIQNLGVQIPYIISPVKTALEVLKGMANCIGGICANSSLSYLGAWFQRRSRGNVYMPARWMNGIPDRQMASFYPSWATVVDLKDDRPPSFQDL